jgi:hypothetical protein
MPYTGIVLTILSIVFGAFLILLAHWLVAMGLFVKATDLCEIEFRRRPVRCVLVGIFTYGILMAVLLGMAGKMGGGPLLIAAIPLIMAFIGSSGLALRIGSDLSETKERWRRGMRGATMLGFCCITPFLGWFIVFPIVMAAGFGALVLAKPWKSRIAPETAAALESSVPALS